MISVESADEVWPFAMGYMAERLRGRCPFCYGHTVNFRAKVSKGSDPVTDVGAAQQFLEKYFGLKTAAATRASASSLTTAGCCSPPAASPFEALA
jgi:hypothetical protein